MDRVTKKLSEESQKTAKFCHFRTPTPNSRLVSRPRGAMMLGVVLKEHNEEIFHTSKISDKAVLHEIVNDFPGRGGG